MTAAMLDFHLPTHAHDGRNTPSDTGFTVKNFNYAVDYTNHITEGQTFSWVLTDRDGETVPTKSIPSEGDIRLFSYPNLKYIYSLGNVAIPRGKFIGINNHERRADLVRQAAQRENAHPLDRVFADNPYGAGAVFNSILVPMPADLGNRDGRLDRLARTFVEFQMTARATEELVLRPESEHRPWNLNLNDLQYYRAQKNVLKGAIWQLFGLKLPRADRLVMELCLERMNQGLSRKNAGLFGDEIPADIVPGR